MGGFELVADGGDEQVVWRGAFRRCGATQELGVGVFDRRNRAIELAVIPFIADNAAGGGCGPGHEGGVAGSRDRGVVVLVGVDEDRATSEQGVEAAGVARGKAGGVVVAELIDDDAQDELGGVRGGDQGRAHRVSFGRSLRKERRPTKKGERGGEDDRATNVQEILLGKGETSTEGNRCSVGEAQGELEHTGRAGADETL